MRNPLEQARNVRGGINEAKLAELEEDQGLAGWPSNPRDGV
jgi:hypothetical protein